MRDGVADLDLGGTLDAGDHIAHVAAAYLPGGTSFILSTPTSSTSYSRPVAKNLTLSPLCMLPFLTLQWRSPAEGVEHRIEDQGLGRACGSPSAPESCRLSRRESGPRPRRCARTPLNTSSGLQPSRSHTSSVTTSTWAESMSILFRTGIISRPWSMAMYRFEMVCAWTPWVASTTSALPRTRRSSRRPRRRSPHGPECRSD